MSDSLMLLTFLVVPVLLIGFFRINAVMVFLSLCLGEILVKYVGNDTNSLISLFSKHGSGSVGKSTVLLVFLIGPAVATAVFMLFSVHGKAKVLINLLPAVATSFLGLLLAVPLLAPGLRYHIETNSLWLQLSRAEDFIVGIGALISLVFMWSQRRGHKHHEGGKHQH